MGMLGRSMGVLLAVLVVCAVLPVDAAAREVPRHTAQSAGKAERAMQEITAQIAAMQEGTPQTPSVSAVPSAQQPPDAVLLQWQPCPAAVRYAVRVLRGTPGASMTVLAVMEQIYTTGLHLPLAAYGSADELYWTVQPLGYQGTPLAPPSAPHPVRGEKENPAAPVLTAEYDKMAYAPLYPVYAWIPLAGQQHHEVEVYRREAGHDRCPAASTMSTTTRPSPCRARMSTACAA